MKLFKKLAAALLAVSMVASLAACGASGGSSAAEAAKSQAPAADQTSQAAPAEDNIAPAEEAGSTAAAPAEEAGSTAAAPASDVDVNAALSGKTIGYVTINSASPWSGCIDSALGQFVQDGSRLMFETVVTFGESDKDVVIEEDADNGDGLNFLAGKTMSYVNSKAFEGTVLAHTDGGVPNLVINVDKPDEENLGRLIYFFEKACAISGYMLGVNPFDQPGVESYKKNMFALLGKPGYEAQKAELEARLNG